MWEDLKHILTVLAFDSSFSLLLVKPMRNYDMALLGKIPEKMDWQANHWGHQEYRLYRTKL